MQVAPGPDEALHKLLTSVPQNVHVDTWRVTGHDLKVAPEIPWAISKYTLHGGRQQGVDLITMDNGVIDIVIVPTRGMGVLEVESDPVWLGWDSPVQEVVHPTWVNLQNRGGLGWLEGFNEWMVRCGLESCGAPCRDRFVTNTGAESEMDLPLHGRIANLPASSVEVVVDRDPPHRLHVRGLVSERTFYGPKLELEVDISTVPGELGLRIEDRVTNRGGASTEFQLLYHVNFGRSILEAGARFVAPVGRVTPINHHAAQSVRQWQQYAGPTPGFVEQVYCLQALGDTGNRTLLLLRNAAGDLGVNLRYSLEELPCLTLWKSTSLAEEGYVTGVEPGTSYPTGRRNERQAGRVPKLEPGESRRFCIDYELLTAADRVSETTREIEGLQGERRIQLDEEPLA